MPAVALARRTVDIGLFSDNAAMHRHYIDVVGLPFVEALPHSPTYSEVFYAANDASLKINTSTEPMEQGTSGYCGLLIARDGVAEPRRVDDPDGLAVTLVPPGYDGISQMGIVCEVPDVDVERAFLVRTIATEDARGTLRIGDTVMALRAGAATHPTPTWRRGFNYYVVFVADIALAHRQLVDAGAEHSAAPLRLADRCVFSWVRAPSGNWIELVQYPEMAPLPDAPLAAERWPEIIRWRETAEPF